MKETSLGRKWRIAGGKAKKRYGFSWIVVLVWSHREFWNKNDTTDTVLWFSSVAQSHPTLCNPMDCSTPGLPVHYQLPELTQTHAHWVGDAIQPSHPLLSPSPPTFSLSQHQGLFQGVIVIPWHCPTLRQRRRTFVFPYQVGCCCPWLEVRGVFLQAILVRSVCYQIQDWLLCSLHKRPINLREEVLSQETQLH